MRLILDFRVRRQVKKAKEEAKNICNYRPNNHNNNIINFINGSHFLRRMFHKNLNFCDFFESCDSSLCDENAEWYDNRLRGSFKSAASIIFKRKPFILCIPTKKLAKSCPFSEWIA